MKLTLPPYIKVIESTSKSTDGKGKITITIKVNRHYILKQKAMFYFYFAIAYIKKHVFRLSIERENDKMLNILKLY